MTSAPTRRGTVDAPFVRAADAVAQGSPTPAALDLAPGEQLHMFGSEQQLLPCNVEVEFNYQLKSAVVRRQGDDGSKVVLAHVGGGVLQPLKRWHSHLEPSERTQILRRIAHTIGEVQVLR